MTASSAPEALADYMRALGCRDPEIVRMGSGASAWRGAIYSVARVTGEQRAQAG